MVHTFECLGNLFMLDVESGSLYQIDGLTKKLIDLKNSPDEFSEGDFSSYAEEDIENAKKEIESLTAEGTLFSSCHAPVQIKNNGVIKSMCLNISHKCNLRCGYCFADGGAYHGRQENMPFATAKAAVDLLIARSGTRKTLEIDFFGGEPLLNFDVVKQTVAYARSKEQSIGKKFRFTITTNALNLTDEITDFFNAEMHNVVISIDGRESVHNHVRKTAGGKDSFDAVLKNALAFKLKRGDKQYYIRGTFTGANKDFANDVLALYGYGFEQLSLEPVVLAETHPLSIKKADLPQLISEYEKLAENYVEMRKNGKWFSFFHFNLDLEGGPCEAKRVKSCGAGCEYIAVAPSGDIYPCHQFVGNSEYKTGNVLDAAFVNRLEDIFENNSVYSKHECNACFAKYYCSGGCAANSANLCGSIAKPVETSCALMKKRTECALAVYALENGAKE